MGVPPIRTCRPIVQHKGIAYHHPHRTPSYVGVPPVRMCRPIVQYKGSRASYILLHEEVVTNKSISIQHPMYQMPRDHKNEHTERAITLSVRAHSSPM